MGNKETKKVETTTAENSEKKKSGKKNLVMVIIALIIILGVVGCYGYYYISSQYFSTDNAKVSGGIYSITPPMPGKLVKFTAEVGDTVSENEIIGRVEGGTYIKSPVSGEVIKSDATLNQIVGQTSVLAVVADTSDLYIRANIEETDVGKIKEGQEVTITLDAYPGKKFKGHVSKVDNLTQTALSGNALSFTTSGTYTKVTQLIPIEITIDDEVELKNIIGTNAFVKIKIK